MPTPASINTRAAYITAAVDAARFAMNIYVSEYDVRYPHNAVERAQDEAATLAGAAWDAAQARFDVIFAMAEGTIEERALTAAEMMEQDAGNIRDRNERWLATDLVEYVHDASLTERVAQQVVECGEELAIRRVA